MANVTTTLADVQQKLLNLFNDKTILIGHSLEYDLASLKLIHSTVIDTSVVFPNTRKPGFKLPLREIVKETLGRNVQQGAAGHDSKEDAQACMELMLWKVGQDQHGARLSTGPGRRGARLSTGPGRRRAL